MTKPSGGAPAADCRREAPTGQSGARASAMRAANHASAGQPENARSRECVPCEIPPFCRTNYFTGRLLTEEDFTGEQRYFRDKLRLHYRTLHGWGVVCGLRVKPHPFCPELRLVVEPGLAIDACGYEIVVPREVEIELPRPRPQKDASSAGQGYGTPVNEPSRPGSTYSSEGQQPTTPQSYAPPAEEPCPPREPEVPLYVCLEYAECETDFMPAPFDECGCNGEQSRRPSRVCEAYTLTLRYGTPAPVDECRDDDCEELLLHPLKACPDPARADCIPLAFLGRYAPGDRVTDDMLDNRSYRPLLPSTRLHDRLLRCLLRRVPIQALTRVSMIGWTHAQEYTCRDFIRFFTGQEAGGPAFEVTFDGPVRPESLTPRVFQAVITRFRGPGGAAMEIAPSLVWSNPERTAFYLQIDRPYAERELDGTWFDVYVTLRCNLVLDQRGRAVDGELLARLQESDYVVSPPTGNGIPGGTLESWIRVRP
jgi:hypothetical protein